MASPFSAVKSSGEVADLKQKLRDLSSERDERARREVVKKVIQNMTLGIDMSPLFSEMILATHTKDLVQKKLIYLFLSNYAESNAEVTLLAISTLHKGCADPNPMVRGLSLRTLCNLRVANLVEYIVSPLTAGVRDTSPYVRKTAVMGVMKLHQIAPTQVRDHGLLEAVRALINDRDPLVVTDAIAVVNELEADKGGIPVRRELVVPLLNRLREFNEWGQCLVLDLCCRYNPDSDAERFQIMNVLETRLQHQSSAVVFAAARVFLQLTQNLPEIHQQVFQRVKAPLLTLMSRGGFELQFATMKHLLLMMRRAPNLFAEDFRYFFCRYNDPPYIRNLKLDLLKEVVTQDNMGDIIAELREYVLDVDQGVARRALRAMGAIAIALQPAAKHVVAALFDFMDMDSDYVLAETVVVMKDLVRKYADIAPHFIRHIQRCVHRVEEANAKSVLVWMLGEYGAGIDDAPYMLEDLAADFATEPAPQVRLELLTACMKLFFRRPPEVQHTLGRVLQAAVADASHADVHDRGLLYYRLLEQGVDEARRVIEAPKPAPTFGDDVPAELTDRLFEEFNTLSVVYGIPSEEFTVQRAPYVPGAAPAARLVEERTPPPSELDERDAFDEPCSASPMPAPSAHESSGRLLDFSLPAPAPAPPPAPRAPALEQRPGLTPAEFQGKWGSLPVSASLQLHLVPIPPGPALEAAMVAQHIFCMAAGSAGDSSKFYFYARQVAGGKLSLYELIFSNSSGKGTLTVKSDAAEDVDMIVLFQSVLRTLTR